MKPSIDDIKSALLFTLGAAAFAVILTFASPTRADEGERFVAHHNGITVTLAMSPCSSERVLALLDAYNLPQRLIDRMRSATTTLPDRTLEACYLATQTGVEIIDEEGHSGGMSFEAFRRETEF